MPAQPTLLGHPERHFALEGRCTVPQRRLIVPGPWEVLVIEDDELDRALVAELLTVRGRGGVRVTEARDLQSGLEALEARRFDLVMLDTKLPEATALHALRAVGDKAPLTPDPSPPRLHLGADPTDRAPARRRSTSSSAAI